MLVSGIKVHRMIIMPEFIVMLLSLVITWVVFLDGQFTPFNAYMLFLLFFAYSIYLYYATQSSATSTKALFKKQEQDTMPEVFETPGVSPWFILAKLVFHLVVMLTSVHFITESAVKIAHHFKLGEFFIGATVLAIGTSLPELAASIVAVRKGAHEIALGNIIGSNIINLWVVLPLAAIFDAIKIPPVLMHRDMPFFFLATILIALQLFKKKSIIHYNRWLGVVLVVLYLLYLYALTIPGWALWA